VLLGQLPGASPDPLGHRLVVDLLADREGLDLARCSAYSDSLNDMPMLTLVGHPNAVNPDLGLRAEARSHGWPVYDFRSGRKATMIALPIAAGAGAVAGGMAAGAAVHRRRSSG
jgi:phosphoserine phosphatase